MNLTRKQQRLLRILAISVVGMFFISSAILAAAYIFTPRLIKYQPEITQEIEAAIELPVIIGDMNAQWRWLSPVINLQDIQVLNVERSEKLLTIKELRVHISVMDFLLHQTVSTSAIIIDNLKTSLTQTEDGGFILTGLKEQSTASPLTIDELLTRLVDNDNIKISNVTIDLLLQDGKQLVVNNINGRLKKGWSKLRFNLSGTLLNPEHEPPVRGTLSIDGKLDPQHFLPHDLNGTINADLEQIDLPTWSAVFPALPAKIASGSGRVAIWTKWETGEPILLQTSLALDNITMSLPTLAEDFNKVPRWEDTNVAGDLQWHKLAQGWELVGKDITLTRDDIDVPPTTLRIVHNVPAEAEQVAWKTQLKAGDYAIKFGVINLAIVEDLITSSPLLEPKLPSWWPPGLTGKLENVEAHISNLMTEYPDFDLSLALNNVGMPYQKDIGVGFQGLTGSLQVKPHTGQLTINSQQLQLQAPDLFTAGIELPKLNTVFSWQKTDGQWLLTGNGRSGILEQGQVKFAGKLLLAEVVEESEIELHAEVSNIPVVPAAAMYMPRPALPEPLVEWLDLALKAGTVQSANVELQGKLKDFPYADKSGKFEVNVHATDAEIDYHDEWPPVKQVEGQLIFRGDEFYANLIKGNIGGANLDQAVVKIPAISDDGFDLQVIGKAEGSADNLVAFLKQTPLWEDMRDRFEFLQVSGPVGLDLSLDLPIGKEDTPYKISGALDFDSANVKMPSWNLTFEQVLGELHFSEEGIYTDNLTANFLGEPVRVQVATQNPTNENRFLAMEMQGNISIQSLQQYFPNPLWQEWKGKTPFTANLTWRQNTDTKASSFKVTTPLTGVAINLPQPFNKTAEQTRTLTFNTTFGGAEQNMQLQYNGVLNANIYTAYNQNQLSVLRGTVNVQSKDTIAMPKTGLQMVANLPNLNIDAWIPIGKRMMDTTSSTTKNYPALNAKINTDKIKVFEKEWAIRSIDVQRSNNHWRLGVIGTNIKGQAVIPDDLQKQAINLNLAYLSWDTQPSETAKPDIAFPPDNFPNFNVNIDHLLLNDQVLGTLTLATRKEKEALAINSIRLTNPSYSVSAAARWEAGKMQTLSYLQGSVTSKNLGQMLKNMQISDAMTNGAGKTKMDFQWVGSPFAWDLNTLQGKMNIEWDNGHLAQIKPGLGRVLSLFNVDSLTRRLRLDFSDVVKKGFTFDTLTADLNFNQGTISTSNGKVSSTSGDIEFSGKAFSANKTLDMNLVVKPSLTGPLPIAATVASGGNPLVGALAMAVDKAITPRITGNIAGMHYKATGDWQDPQIKRTD